MPPRYRTVLFDLDGTLIDSVRLILDSYHHTMAVHGLPAQGDEIWLSGLGTPLRAQFGPWGTTPDVLDALVTTYREFNLRWHDERIRPYPGIADMIRAVRAAGLATALVTSKNREGAARGLAIVGLQDSMDFMVCADDVERHKPHPEPVLRALDALGATAAGTLFVGDSLHDMHSGRAAGTATGAALWGPFPREHLLPSEPDHWLDHPGHLLEVLEIAA